MSSPKERAAWSPSSWRSLPQEQAVPYPPGHEDELRAARDRLASLPPLVSSREVEDLRQHLADVQRGQAFLLQAGDCSELFRDLTATQLEHKLSLLLTMSLVLIWGTKKRVVRVARLAGQYAKPRSAQTETLSDGSKIPSYRGDMINGLEHSERVPSASRLVDAYFHAAATGSYVRTLLSSGFSSLPRGSEPPWAVNLKHVRDQQLQDEYQSIVSRMAENFHFMDVVSGSQRPPSLDSASIYFSHESLVLDYEEPLTRQEAIKSFRHRNTTTAPPSSYYDFSAHFLWCGARTVQTHNAHVEFLRGVRNPIGVKVSPTTTADELVQLVKTLDPHKEVGRLTLICRYGANKVRDCLPGHIKAVQETGHPVIWSCDPMHGNTKTLHNVKTRDYNDILGEVLASIEIHEQLGSRLGGVHIEVTGELDEQGGSVTEVIGGSAELAPEDLGKNYLSGCDPRLNHEQGLDLAFALARRYMQSPP